MNWNAFWEKADLVKFKKIEGMAEQKKSAIWALFGQSARVCDAPTDKDGKPIPPSRQRSRYGPDTPEVWLIDELVKAHADYNRGPDGRCQVHIDTYTKFQRGEGLSAQEREDWNHAS